MEVTDNYQITKIYQNFDVVFENAYKIIEEMIEIP